MANATTTPTAEDAMEIARSLLDTANLAYAGVKRLQAVLKAIRDLSADGKAPVIHDLAIVGCDVASEYCNDVGYEIEQHGRAK